MVITNLISAALGFGGGVALCSLAAWVRSLRRAPVRACRSCGCTDDRACPGGCCWVEADLCSACAGDEYAWPCECGYFREQGLTCQCCGAEPPSDELDPDDWLGELFDEAVEDSHVEDSHEVP